MTGKTPPIPSLLQRLLRPLRRPALLLRIAAALAVLAVILLLGARQIREKIAIVKPLQYIGHADEASYALQGKSVSQGKGIHIDYISTFFLAYPPTITHREDHWPPFMGYSIAPFFYFLGTETWVARIPGILYGSIGLPLAAALLAYALTRRGYVALTAALLMMATPEIYLHSMRTLADVATAMLVTLFCASVLLAARRPWMHLLAGIFIACASYAKGSELLLLALYPVLAVLSSGFPVLRRRWFYAGIASTLLLLAPFWYANWRDYGNPLHTTQNYVSAFFGFENWDSEFYKPHWGTNLPQLSDRWQKHPNYWRLSRIQLVEEIGSLLSGATDRRGWNSDNRQSWNDFGDWGLKTREFLLGENLLHPQRGRRTPPQKAPLPRPVKPILQWTAPAVEGATLGALALLVLSLAASPLLLGISATRWTKQILQWKRRQTQRAAKKTTPQENRPLAHQPQPHPLDQPNSPASQPILASEPADKNPLVPLSPCHLVPSSPCPLVTPQTDPHTSPPASTPESVPTAKSLFPLAGPVLGLWLVIVVHLVFIAYFWSFEPRFCFLILPLLIALGCAAASSFVEWPLRAAARAATWIARKARRHKPAPPWLTHASAALQYASPILTLLAASAALLFNQRIYQTQTSLLGRGGVNGTFPFYYDEPRIVADGKWIKEHLPNAIIMCRGPWELLFYMGPNNKAVGLPNPADMGATGAAEVFAIARYYRVTHMLLDSTRPCLAAYVYQRKPGLKRVPNCPDPLYELDWNLLPKKTVDQLWPR